MVSFLSVSLCSFNTTVDIPRQKCHNLGDPKLDINLYVVYFATKIDFLPDCRNSEILFTMRVRENSTLVSLFVFRGGVAAIVNFFLLSLYVHSLAFFADCDAWPTGGSFL